MKKLDRYILAEFFPPLLLVVLGLASIVLLIQVVDMLPRLRDWHASTSQIVLFHLFQFPFLVAQILPVGVMLATLVALGNLARGSELAAMGAGGVSRLRIATPLLWTSLALSVLLFGASETLVPAASARSRWIQKVQIEHRDVDFDLSFRDQMVKNLSGGRQLYVRGYDALRGSMGRLAILQFEGGRLARRIDADGAEHVGNGVWRLRDGMDRHFGEDGRVSGAVAFRGLEEDLGSRPRDFMVDSDKKEQDLVQLSMAELRSIIRRLGVTGGDDRKERAVFHVHISYPFSCLILALLGASLPYLFPTGKRAMAGAAVGLVAALACGMLYLVFVQVGLSLGKSGALPVLLGAWLGNIVFGAAGAYTMWRVNR